MSYVKLSRRERLAAEFYGYSLAHYADHVEIKNERFTRYMPDFVENLERAESEQWQAKRIATTFEVPEIEVPEMLIRLREAKNIINAANASESFRIAVRRQIEDAVSQGLDDSAAIDDLVIQICYCAADLGCLLEWEGKNLSEYSDWLRREKGVDYTGIGLPNLDEDPDEEEP